VIEMVRTERIESVVVESEIESEVETYKTTMERSNDDAEKKSVAPDEKGDAQDGTLTTAVLYRGSPGV
jgi:hypothetical protein